MLGCPDVVKDTGGIVKLFRTLFNVSFCNPVPHLVSIIFHLEFLALVKDFLHSLEVGEEKW